MPTQDAEQDIELEYDAPKEIEIDDEKILALAQHLEIARDDEDILTISDAGDNRYQYGHREYLVLTDSEADDAWDKELENYIEECILPELPEHLQSYFDNEAWKRDARIDGRGHSLSPYDSNEYDATVEGTDYYIYRLN